MNCNTVQWSAVNCSAVQCSVVNCSEVKRSAVQCSEVKRSAVQCSEVQCSAVLCSAVAWSPVPITISLNLTGPQMEERQQLSLGHQKEGRKEGRKASITDVCLMSVCLHGQWTPSCPSSVKSYSEKLVRNPVCSSLRSCEILKLKKILHFCNSYWLPGIYSIFTQSPLLMNEQVPEVQAMAWIIIRKIWKV